MRLPRSAQRDGERGAEGGGHLGGRLALQHRRERHRRAGADRTDIEAEHRGRQQADIGEHGKAPADACVMLQERHAEGRQQIAQAVALAAAHRLGKAEHQLADALLQRRPA